MARGKSSKHKDKNKKGINPVKAIKASEKSLRALKKVEKQLHALIEKGEQEKKQFNTLQAFTERLAKQLKQTEKSVSELAQKQNIAKLKDKLKKKTARFKQLSDKFSKDISLFRDLEQRAAQRIESLEQQTQPLALQFGDLSTHHEQLYEKINHFELELNQLSDSYHGTAPIFKQSVDQLRAIEQTIAALEQQYEHQKAQIKVLQADTDTIRKSMETVQDIDKSVTAMAPRIDQLEHQNELLNHSVKQLQSAQDTQSNQLEQLQLIHQAVSRVTDISQEQDAHIKLLQVDTGNIRKSLEEIQNIENSLIEVLPKLDELENKSKELINENSDINEVVNHLDKVQETHKKELRELAAALEKAKTELSEQLASQIEETISQLQEKQDTASSHHDELSRQFLTQQQQLESMDQQLASFNPLLETSSQHNEQLNKLSQTMSELTEGQQQLSDIDVSLQQHLAALGQKLNKSYQTQQQKLEQVNSQLSNQDNHLSEQTSALLAHKQAQDEQNEEIIQLQGHLRKRSITFGLAITGVVFALAGLMYFLSELNNSNKNQDLANTIKTETEAVKREYKTDLDRFKDSQKKSIDNQIQQFKQQVSAQLSQTQLLNKTSEANLQEALGMNQNEQERLGQSFSNLKEQLNNRIMEIKEEVDTLKKHNLAKAAPLAHKSKALPITIDSSDIKPLNNTIRPFYGLQLMGARHLDSLAAFINQYKLNDNTQILQTHLADQPWYIIIHGHYETFQEARLAMNTLPDSLKQAWIRKLP
jgi:septal ring-binding cell division protein DamX